MIDDDRRLPVSRRWLGRVALGAGSLLLAAWLLAPRLGELLRSDPVLALDTRLTAVLQAAMADPAFAESMRWLSLLHGTAGILAAAAIAGVLLWRSGDHALLPVLAAAVPGGLLLNFAVKLAVQRARPDPAHALEALASFSFPSGHTAGAAVLYGTAAAWLWPRLHSSAGRAALLLGGVSMVLLVAASRIARGMHYPSDCLAAMLEALVWLTVCLAGVALERRPDPSPRLQS